MKYAMFSVIGTAFLAAMPLFGQGPTKDLRKPRERVINVRAVAFSTDGQLLAACCGEPKDVGEVVVWDARTHKMRWSHRIERGMPSVAFAPDGKTLAVGSFSETCYLFDAGSGKLLTKLPGHGESARSVAFSFDGQTLAVGSYDQTIRLWDWRTGKTTRMLEGQGDKVYSLAYFPDGKRLASGGSMGSVCIWDETGKLLHKKDEGATPLAFDPHGQWLATAGNDSTVTLRSIADFSKVLAHYDRIFAYQVLVIHPSSKFFAASSGDRSVAIYRIDLAPPTPADEKRVRELMAQWDNDDHALRENASQELRKMGHVAKALLTTAAKEAKAAEVRIRARDLLQSLETLQPITRLRGHEENVRCARFSPDGAVLATGGGDGAVLLWDAKTYQLRATIDWPVREP